MMYLIQYHKLYRIQQQNIYRNQHQNPDPQPFWRRYDGSEECISSWQAAPIIFIILLLLLPLAMITRCIWLCGRMWRLETGGIVCRGWFWENSYYQFYSLSFQEKAPHWLPFQLCVRPLPLPPPTSEKCARKFAANYFRFFVLFLWCIHPPPLPSISSPLPNLRYQRIVILLIQLIPLPYWRMFASFIVLCIFLLADVAIRPWQLADVQRLSTVR
jgi:hypothetical protein